MLKKAFILFLTVFLTMNAGYLSATVLTLYNVGPKAATMAGAFVGCAENTTAIYYNPAGLTFQSGLSFRINVSYYNYDVKAELDEPHSFDQSSEPQLIGSFFVAYTYKDRISIGIGAFTPYSIETKWQAVWPGDPININSHLKAFTIRSVIALKIINSLSVGLGLDYIDSSIRWDYHHVGRLNAVYQLTGSGRGSRFNAGILFKPSHIFQIGGRYEQEVAIEHRGSVEDKIYFGNGLATDAQGNPIVPDYSKPELAPGQDVYSHITYPREAVLGFVLTPSKKFTFQADFHWSAWSSFTEWVFYAVDPDDSLSWDPRIDPDSEVDTSGKIKAGIDLNMKDTWSYMLGGAYFLKDELSLMIGYAKHQSPINDENLTPILPLVPRNVVSFGVGFDGPARSITDQSLIGNLTFDAYIQYVMLEERTSAFPGYPFTFGGNYWVFGFGVGFYL
jgi:long-chain fatty acid transport protein